MRSKIAVQFFRVVGEVADIGVGVRLELQQSLWSERRFQRKSIGGHCTPIVDRLRLDLDVVLHRPGVPAHPHRLNGAGRGLRENNSALGRLRHAHGMPLQAFLRFWHARKDWVGEAGLRKLDIEDADLGWTLWAAGAAQRIRQKLMAEAQPKERPVELAHPAPDRPLLRDEPGMLIDIPHIHRPAHHPERVIGLQRRNLLTRIELDGIPLDTVLREEFSQHAGMLAVDMLENKKPH